MKQNPSAKKLIQTRTKRLRKESQIKLMKQASKRSLMSSISRQSYEAPVTINFSSLVRKVKQSNSPREAHVTTMTHMGTYKLPKPSRDQFSTTIDMR
jgi:hypothetical protein